MTTPSNENEEVPLVDDEPDTKSRISASHDAKKIKKLLTETKVSTGKSAWATTLETFGMSEGKRHKHDVLLVHVSVEEAIKALQEMGKAKSWEFKYTPMDDFGANTDDIYRAFCLWAREAKEDDSVSSDTTSSSTTANYNISKAFRRLESYADWMDKNCSNLNLKGSTMKDIAKIWNMKLTYDKDNRAVWWIDIGALDLKKIKQEVSHDNTLRLFVWLCHLVLFDPKAQENGFVFVQAIGKKGIYETLTCISMDVGTKMDRLSIGVLPIKMQAFYGFHNPGWMRVAVGLIKAFMSSKMRKRMVMIPNKQNPQTALEEALGKDCIPCGITQLTGTVEKDIVEDLLEKL